MKNKRISDQTKKELQPFLRNYLQLLIDGLVEDRIIRQVENPLSLEEKRFELTREVKDKVSGNNLVQEDSKIINSLLAFKRIVNDICQNLNYKDINDIANTPLITLLKIIEDAAGFSLSYTKQLRLRNLTDIGEKLLENNESDDKTLEIFKELRINFNADINRLFEFYTLEKARLFLNDFDFEKEVNLGSSERIKFIDFVGRNENRRDLIFEVKYRKHLLSSVKEMLFQGYEYLNRYDKISGKSNLLIMVTYTEEDFNTFEKANNNFYQNLAGLFPEYASRIIFIPISTKRLQLIDEQFKKLNRDLLELQTNIAMFSDNPWTIPGVDNVVINTNFLTTPIGSFAIWVKLKPVKYYYEKLMNYQYILAHATGDYKSLNGQYQNVFSLSLAPDQTNITGKNPTQLRWRVWISNSRREHFLLNSQLLSNEIEQWYHILIRWNHNRKILEFLIDGQLVDSSEKYLNFWPSEIMNVATLGSWGNKTKIHDLNLPVYRLFSSSEFLNNAWLDSELHNNPSTKLKSEEQ